MANPLRLNPDLVAAAERAGLIQKRSVPKQIEFWAALGRAVEKVLDYADVFAILQGLKKITLEPTDGSAAAPEDVFAALETARTRNTLTGQVTTAATYYEASPGRPGFIDQVNGATGERRTGRFANGEFEALAG